MSPAGTLPSGPAASGTAEAEVSLLGAIARELLGFMSLDRLLAKVVEVLSRELSLYFVAIALVEEGDRLVYRAGHGTRPEPGVRFRDRQTDCWLPLSQGLIGKAARLNETVIVDDVRQAPEYVAVDFLADTRSELVVPVSAGGRVLAVIDAQSDRPGAFGPADARRLEAIAVLIAVAIENANNLARLEQRHLELQLTEAVSRIAVEARTPRELCERVSARVRETFGVEAVAVFALPGPGRDLRLLGGTVRPRAEADLPRTVPFGRGPLGRAIDLGCTLAYSRGRGGEAEDSTLPASASEIAVPLAQAGRSLGGLLLASAVPDRFGPADAQLLEAAGASIAQALGNALAAERLQELRNDLSRMVVHDVRNPMMVILTALSVLERNAAVLADERSQRYLRNATAAGDEILRLMTSLLDIEKLESGTLALHRVPYAVEDALTRVVENGRILAEVQELALALDVAPGLPPVLADVDLLLRTFENVLGNALKFTPAGGAVRVAARLATPEELAARLPEAPGAVLVEVVDNGPGIPDEEQARVFEKFGVVESRRRHGKASTGLGLALCKLVISAHGGAIWVESRLGAGARFVILLPASE